jgi:hypothetical protein
LFRERTFSDAPLPSALSPSPTESHSSSDSEKTPRARSLRIRQQVDITQMQQVSGRVSRSKWQHIQSAGQNISLAISDILPDMHIYIETVWEDEVVLDKRKSAEGHYEYLVKGKGMSRTCVIWKHPKDITDPELVRMYEERRNKQIRDKTHLAAWYPFKEELVVQWKDAPFFIVSYGGGQFNKFCIVGLDRSRTSLKCKNANQSRLPQHQIHVHMVEKEIIKQGLRLHHKTISPATDLFLPAAISDTTRSFSKPISQQLIYLTATDVLHKTRSSLHQDSNALPVSFTPKTHPEFCKCETRVTNPDGTFTITHSTQYKASPDPTSKATTLWLPHGAPITNRKAYVWRCQNYNPACNVFYDGHDDGIFNYSNSTMVSHAILLEFSFGLVVG